MNRRNFIRSSGAFIGGSAINKSESDEKSNEGDAFISELRISEKLVDDEKNRGVVCIEGEITNLADPRRIKMVQVYINLLDEDESKLQSLYVHQHGAENSSRGGLKIEEDELFFEESFFAEKSLIESIELATASFKINWFEEEY